MQILKGDIRDAHFAYAREIVGMYCGKDMVENAEIRYNEVANGSLPTEIKEIKCEETELTIIEMLIKSQFAKSSSQARQLVLGKGVKVNGEVVSDFFVKFKTSENPIISKGKNNFAKFVN